MAIQQGNSSASSTAQYYNSYNPSEASKRSSGKKSRKRKKSSMILWILLIIIVLWMCLHFLPERFSYLRPVPEATALIPLLIVPLLVILAIALARRSWGQSLVSFLLIAIETVWSVGYFTEIPQSLNQILALPRQTASNAVSDGAPGSEASSLSNPSAVTVMTINARYGQADTGSIVQAIKTNHVDVLCVQEATDSFIDRMGAAGISDELPFLQSGAKTSRDNGGFNAVWTRKQPVEQHDKSVQSESSQIPTAVVSVNGHNILFGSTHPKSPQRGGESWRNSINALKSFAQVNNPSLGTSTHIEATVIAGDMNSGIHHSVFRNILSSGLTDASYNLHKGMHPTFPASWPLVPSLIEIDHVLYSGPVRAATVKSLVIPRTDHRALVSTLIVG